MALSFVSRVGASPLGRAGVAIFSILALAGAVQFGLPMMCGASASICRGDESVAAGGLDAAQLDAALGEGGAISSFVGEQDVAAAVENAPAPGPSPQGGGGQDVQVVAASTYDTLIASTFAALDLGLIAAPAPLAPAGDTPSGDTPAGEVSPGALTSRSVTTVAINEDGTPVGEATPTPAPSPQGGGEQESAVQVTQVAEAATSAAAEPESSEPAETRSSMAYAPASGDVASVTGAGANVRSLPQRGGSDVLFALRGGEEVTIVEMSKGWARIVDKQGRSGWIYGQYLDRS